MSPPFCVDVCQFLFCFCSLYIYHKMLEECLYGLPCKRNKAIKRIALAAISPDNRFSLDLFVLYVRENTHIGHLKRCMTKLSCTNTNSKIKYKLIISIWFSLLSKDVKDSNITWQSSIILFSLQTAPIQVKIRSYCSDRDLQNVIFYG